MKAAAGVKFVGVVLALVLAQAGAAQAQPRCVHKVVRPVISSLKSFKDLPECEAQFDQNQDQWNAELTAELKSERDQLEAEILAPGFCGRVGMPSGSVTVENVSQINPYIYVGICVTGSDGKRLVQFRGETTLKLTCCE